MLLRVSVCVCVCIVHWALSRIESNLLNWESWEVICWSEDSRVRVSLAKSIWWWAKWWERAGEQREGEWRNGRREEHKITLRRICHCYLYSILLVVHKYAKHNLNGPRAEWERERGQMQAASGRGRNIGVRWGQWLLSFFIWIFAYPRVVRGMHNVIAM